MFQSRIRQNPFHFITHNILYVFLDLQIVSLDHIIVQFPDYRYFLISVLLFLQSIVVIDNLTMKGFQLYFLVGIIGNHSYKLP